MCVGLFLFLILYYPCEWIRRIVSVRRRMENETDQKLK